MINNCQKIMNCKNFTEKYCAETTGEIRFFTQGGVA